MDVRGLTRLVLTAICLLVGCTGPATTPDVDGSATPRGADANTTRAVGAVLDAFAGHPIVAVGEIHGSQVEHDFLTALLRDPRTPSVLDDIVVEFGTARYQSVMDRFIAGEHVEEADLRRAWTETTQISGVWSQPMYRRFFETVREVNQGLPASQRLRVLLGDPPIDWTLISASPSCDEADPSCPDYWLFRRDEHFAQVVERESLQRGRRALLIAGVYHLTHGGPAGVTSLLDQRHAGATYVIVPHDPSQTTTAVEERLSRWAVPSVTPLAGSWLGGHMVESHSGTITCDGPDCEDDPSFPGPTTLAQMADAYLYLGPTLVH